MTKKETTRWNGDELKIFFFHYPILSRWVKKRGISGYIMAICFFALFQIYNILNYPKYKQVFDLQTTGSSWHQFRVGLYDAGKGIVKLPFIIVFHPINSTSKLVSLVIHPVTTAQVLTNNLNAIIHDQHMARFLGQSFEMLTFVPAIWEVLGDFVFGILDALKDFVCGIFQIILHPIDTLASIWHLIIHPINSSKAIWADLIEKAGEDALNKTWNTGYLVGTVPTFFIGAESVIGKVREVERYAKYEKVINETAKAAEKAEEFEKAAKIGNGLRKSPQPLLIERRPQYKNGFVDMVYDNAKQIDGKVYDPNTGEELAWNKNLPRNGQWDMGHKPGKEYRKLVKDFKDGKLTLFDFLKEYNNPDNYQPEAISSNRGRTYEEK